MRIFQPLINAQRRRRTVQQLRALPPEVLRDIGIEPHRDIDQMVSEMLAARSEKRPPRRSTVSVGLGAPQAANC